MALKKGKELWFVVYVYRGIPDKVEVYPNRTTAEKREKMLRKKANLVYDETGLFKAKFLPGGRLTGVRWWNREISFKGDP
jgi:hypothetical protein